MGIEPPPELGPAAEYLVSDFEDRLALSLRMPARKSARPHEELEKPVARRHPVSSVPLQDSQLKCGEGETVMLG